MNGAAGGLSILPATIMITVTIARRDDRRLSPRQEDDGASDLLILPGVETMVILRLHSGIAASQQRRCSDADFAVGTRSVSTTTTTTPTMASSQLSDNKASTIFIHPFIVACNYKLNLLLKDCFLEKINHSTV